MSYTSVSDYEYEYYNERRLFTVYFKDDETVNKYQDTLSEEHEQMAIYLHERLLS